MWVRLAGWMIVDEEPPLPVPGSVWEHIGVRVVGVIDRAGTMQNAGIAEVANVRQAVPWPSYLVTGCVHQPRAVNAPGDAIAEFAIRVGGFALSAQVPGQANITDGEKVTVRARLSVISSYEWEAFDLTDVRTKWLVNAVKATDDDAALLDLTSFDP